MYTVTFEWSHKPLAGKGRITLKSNYYNYNYIYKLLSFQRLMITNTITLGKYDLYVHLLCINQMFQYCHTCVIPCNLGEVYIFDHRLYITALEHARMLILSIKYM